MPRHGLAVTFVVRNIASFEKPLFFFGNQNCFSAFLKPAGSSREQKGGKRRAEGYIL
jgi:hypothetical protein